jgi:hypothetical protein
VIDTLSRAVRVTEDRRYENGGIRLDADPVTCVIEALPSFSFTSRRGKEKDVIDPEVLPRETGLPVHRDITRAIGVIGKMSNSRQVAGELRKMIEGRGW